MNKAGKLLAMLLALAMLFSLAACGNSGTEADSAASNDSADAGEDTASDELRDNSAVVSDASENASSADARYPSVVIGTSQEIDALDPSKPSGGCRPVIGPNVYETLFDFDINTKEVYPVLVQDYEVVDELHYILTLYDYIVDSQGNEIHAEDVAYCYKAGVEGLIKSVAKYIDGDGVVALDDYRVEFNLLEPLDDVGDFLTLFSSVWIYSQAAYEASPDGFATDPVATGPYVVTDFVAGASCTLEANDNYWQKDDLTAQQQRRNVQQIVYNTISSSSQLVVALKTGAIDFATAIDFESVGDFAEGGEYSNQYSLDVFQDNKWYNLVPNCSENSPCSDENLRLAMFYAIDTAQIAEALNIDATPMVDLCNSNCAEFDETANDVSSYMNTYDPELAKQYLEASSYDGTPLKMLIDNSELSSNTAQLIQIFLGDIGIDVELLVYDDATYSDYKDWVDDMWDFCFEYRAGGDYAVRALQVAYYRDVQHTVMRADDDDTLAELFATALSVDGHSAESWTALREYILEQAYVLPMYSVYNYSVYSNDITGICRTYKLHLLPGACTYTQS